MFCGKSGEINVDYEIKLSPGRGLGVFAKRAFKKNEIIMVERTLHCKTLEHLTGGVKEAFLELSRGPDWHWHQRFGDEPPPPSALAPETQWIRRMIINGISAEGGPVVCINISRINHACYGADNCSHRLNTAKNLMIINANRDIAAGDEITFSYVALGSSAKSGLMRNFGINCDCEYCKDPVKQSQVDKLTRLKNDCNREDIQILNRICACVQGLFLADFLEVYGEVYLDLYKAAFVSCYEPFPAVSAAMKESYSKLRLTLLVDEEA